MSFGSSVSHSTRTRCDGTVSEREALSDRRTTRALAHWRSRRDRDSTLAAQNMAASSLCGSGGLLLSWHAVRRIRLGAHATRDPQHRWRCDKRLPSRELDQNKRSGSHVVVSGHYHSTHLDCRRADQDDAASAADCLQILIGRSSRVLCDPWRVALDASSSLEAARLDCMTSRGLARSRTAASGSIAGRERSPFRNYA